MAPDADRVRQRLAGLLAATEPVAAARGRDRGECVGLGLSRRHRAVLPARPLRAARRAAADRAGGAAHERRSRRAPPRRALRPASRVDAVYRYNMLDATPFDPADQLYLTNAYVDLADHEHDWSARLGRQSMHTSGVLGRFDGAHAEYQWRPAVGFNLTIGRPVDYPRHAVDNHREFAAFSADFDKLVKQWDVSFFGIDPERSTASPTARPSASRARHRGTAWSVVEPRRHGSFVRRAGTRRS